MLQILTIDASDGKSKNKNDFHDFTIKLLRVMSTVLFYMVENDKMEKFYLFPYNKLYSKYIHGIVLQFLMLFLFFL